jgi:FdhE protein
MGDNSDNTLDRLRKRIDAIIKEKPSHKEALEFLKKVMTEQYRTRTGAKTVPIKIDTGKTRALMEGNPLLDKKDISLDVPSTTKLFKKLCGLLGRREETSGDAKRVNEALRNKDIDLMELFEHIGIENDGYMRTIAKKLRVREDVLPFLAENTIRPIFEAYAHELKNHVDQEIWHRGYCPICGSKPLIAELREEGARFLVCSLCSFEWRFIRLKCPSCGNDDHKTLKYFYTESEGAANRIDICDKCKRYIKTIDTREVSGGIIPIVEDMGTLYLDVLAQEEGYLRGGIAHHQRLIN